MRCASARVGECVYEKTCVHVEICVQCVLSDADDPAHEVCCSVLQRVAVCCSVVQSIAAGRCSLLQCIAVNYSVLQCPAMSCSVLQCVAECC